MTFMLAWYFARVANTNDIHDNTNDIHDNTNGIHNNTNTIHDNEW